jgi:RHS repeat-associated protein
MTYDLNGNLATAQDASGTATYTWDVRNRLTSLTAPGFSATFAYDALGRRTGKTVQGVTTNFVYDGLNPVQEKNGSTVTANLLTGLGIDQVLTRTDSAGTRELFTDALGSTVALADTAGVVQTSYTYEPFGGTTQSGSASTNSYRYTGREDDGTGLMYYRARYYSPRLQRFISEDPIGFRGRQANLYGYVRNAPTRYIDPYGLVDFNPIPFSLPESETPAQCPFSPKFDDPLTKNPLKRPSDVEAINKNLTFDWGGPAAKLRPNVRRLGEPPPGVPYTNSSVFDVTIAIPF